MVWGPSDLSPSLIKHISSVPDISTKANIHASVTKHNVVSRGTYSSPQLCRSYSETASLIRTRTVFDFKFHALRSYFTDSQGWTRK